MKLWPLVSPRRPPKRSRASPSATLFFCHIPKTGGTSLRKALESAIPPWEILPDEFMIKRQGGAYPTVEVLLGPIRFQRQSVRLVRGHYHMSTANLLGPDTHLMTVVRDPVKRTVSHLKHLLRKGTASPEQVRSCFEQGTLPIPDNLQCRFLAGFDQARDEPAVLSANHAYMGACYDRPGALAERAIETARLCRYLATTDDLESLARDLSETFVGAPLRIGRLNEGKAVEFAFSERELDIVRDLNAEDIRLYEYAKRRASPSGQS